MKKTFASCLGRSVFKPQLAPVLPLAAMIAIIGFQQSVFAQGSLTPPGAPAPMMKTLAQPHRNLRCHRYCHRRQRRHA
jgi:hypothetical protein